MGQNVDLLLYYQTVPWVWPHSVLSQTGSWAGAAPSGGCCRMQSIRRCGYSPWCHYFLPRGRWEQGGLRKFMSSQKKVTMTEVESRAEPQLSVWRSRWLSWESMSDRNEVLAFQHSHTIHMLIPCSATELYSHLQYMVCLMCWANSSEPYTDCNMHTQTRTHTQSCFHHWRTLHWVTFILGLGWSTFLLIRFFQNTWVSIR